MQKWILLSLLCSSPTFGQINVYLDLGCPYTSVDRTNGYHTLRHVGSMVSGYGFQELNGREQTAPLYQGIVPTGVPQDIEQGHYVRAGTSYDPVYGIASCHYVSSGKYPPFDVFYFLKNGRNGVVRSSTFAYLRIMFDFGFKPG